MNLTRLRGVIPIHRRGPRGSFIASAVMISLTWFLGCVAVSEASGVVGLGDEQQILLTPYLSIYRDATAAMSLEEVQADWSRSAESLGTQRRPSFGFSTDAIWTRWTVRNERAEPAFWVIRLKTTRLDKVDVYLLRASGENRHFIAGNSRPRSPDLVDDIYPAFPLMLEAGEQADIFLRIQSETVRQLPLEMITTGRLAGAQSREQLAHAALFGYLFALMVMSLLFGVIARERGFALYALALAGCFASFFILGGFYVWLDLPGRGLVAKQGLILVSEFVLFMMLVYLRYLLDLPRNMPGINRLVTWTLRASGVIVLAMLVTPYRIAYPTILIHMSLVGGISVVVAFMAWCKGLKEARFYALALLLYWTLFALNTYKHIAAESVSRPFWEKAFAGSAFAMTFFFFAMADRVREIRRAAGRAQDKLLELEQRASRDLRNKLRQEQLLIRDLHDGIGGLTANLAILAEVGRRDAPATLERDRFERISQMASDGSVEVRGLMSSLEARDMSWPDFFDECRRFGRVALNPHGIDFQLDETGFADQTGPGVYAGLSLLRVVKEAMTNAVKHAQGTKVRLSAEFAADRLRIIIRDDGKGLASTINHGRGLRNMEARMLEMRGNMTCASKAGLEIVLELPLPVVLVDVEPEAGKRAER